MELWVIYKHPKDYPDKYVARKWILDEPTSEAVFANTLEEARLAIPKGLIRMERNNQDDPCIVEIWL